MTGNSCWFGVTYKGTQFQQIEEFQDLLLRTGLGKNQFPNREEDMDLDSLKALLPDAVGQARQHMGEERDAFEEMINAKLDEHLKALDRLKDKQYKQLDLLYTDPKKISKKDQARREIDRTFDDFFDWVQDTMSTEKNSYIQVIAVLKGI